ncbi:MAG TPA: FG-GAP-like repeat-containing protein [Planctomycetota bacterium]|nr:FG-GAP-like repeat-containing protein [Planctomycetota bacterium]
MNSGFDAAMHARPRRRLAPVLALVLGLAACGGPLPLALVPTPVPIGHDGFTVHDAVLVDLDHDGDMDIVASTEPGLRYLRAEGGRWTDETLGTALEQVAPVTRLQLDGADLLCQRGADIVRLKWSGIGSWHEVPAAQPASMPQEFAPPERAVEADLDGDGIVDRASLAGRGVRIERRDAAGGLHDVTSAVAADALPLRADGVRLYAADLDGDKDTDLLAVGDRLMVFLNNGGRLTEPSASGSR